MTRKHAWALLGGYCLASAGLSVMANAALKLAQPAPCADCADKHAAVVDVEPPASPAAGDLSSPFAGDDLAAAGE